MRRFVLSSAVSLLACSGVGQGVIPTDPGDGEAGPEDLTYGPGGVGLSCTECTADPRELASRMHASSERVEDGQVRGAALAFDGRPGTAWCQGMSGDGVGAWIEVRFVRPVRLAGFTLLGGDFADASALRAHARIRRATIETDGGSVMVPLADPTVPPRSALTGESVAVGDAWFEIARGAPATVDLGRRLGDAGTLTETLRLRVEEVYPGSAGGGVCVSELVPLIADGAQHR